MWRQTLDDVVVGRSDAAERRLRDAQARVTLGRGALTRPRTTAGRASIHADPDAEPSTEPHAETHVEPG